MSSADRVSYYYVEEATIGLTPVNAALKALRITGESLKANFQYEQSKELRADRTEPEQILIAENVSGDLNHEFLSLDHKDFIAWVCGQDAWTVVDAHTQTLQNGVAGKSFSVLKKFTDLADINHLFKGQFINTWNLNIQKKAILTGSFGVVGMDSENGAIAGLLSGAPTYGVAGTTEPINGSSHITAIKMNGTTMLSAIDKASLSIANNYKAQEQLGSLTPTGYTQGRIQVTGMMDIYFKTETEYNYYKNGTPWSFELDFVDNDTNGFNLLLDRCKFEDMEVVAGGTNQDIIAKGKFRATYNSATDRVFRLTSTTP